MLLKPTVKTLAALSLLSGLLIVTPARAGTSVDFTVRDLNGKYVRLSDFKGKLVELTFWSSFCKVCQKKLNHLEKWQRKYGARGFVVLGVSVDGPETEARVRPIVKRHKLSFPVVIDRDAQISKLFNPKRVTPLSVFIKNGKKIKVREGFQLSEVPLMERELDELLKR